MHAVLTRVDTHNSVSVDRERRHAILCRLDPTGDTHFCERRRTLLRIDNWYAMLKSSNENETNCPLTVA